MAFSTLERIKIRLRQYESTVDSNGDVELHFTKESENIILEDLMAKAKQDIIMYRHYPDYYTQEQIDEDVATKWENILIELVLYDYTTEGADFETVHNENGVNRTFVKRESIMGKILPFCKVLV